LDEETFDNEFISWPRVKCGQCKSGMHYIFVVEMLKKKENKTGE